MTEAENGSKGGRGKKAPYESMHYRIPLPLKPAIENIAARYRDLVSDYDSPENVDLINASVNEANNLVTEVDEKAIILKAMEKFIEAQKQSYRKNGSQKEFTLDTRKWDAFREFQKFINHLK